MFCAATNSIVPLCLYFFYFLPEQMSDVHFIDLVTVRFFIAPPRDWQQCNSTFSPAL